MFMHVRSSGVALCIGRLGDFQHSAQKYPTAQPQSDLKRAFPIQQVRVLDKLCTVRLLLDVT